MSAQHTGIEKIEMETFAKKLHELMLKKGLSQSDLARMIWGTTKTSKGYDVARNRDRISVYLKGGTWPSPVHLSQIADALDVDPEELAPDITASSMERENPEVQMTALAGKADKVYLRVNKLVPMTLAAQIVSMLAEFDE